jgi:acetolactate synthase-1/2/3 large subunit
VIVLLKGIESGVAKLKLSGAKIIMETLLEQGVDTIFGYPGGQIMPLYDALYDYTEDGRIRHILTAHEQGATHAADGYARSTGGVGVCFATSGPGATNTVTGIATANIDSVPMVVITGQVPIASIGKDSFQEVDIVGITLPVTKHSYAVRAVEELAPIIREAFCIAKSGRPGVVLVDVPKDLMVAKCDYRKAEPLPAEKIETVSDEDILEIARLINESKRPVIYAGGGITVSDTSRELRQLAETSNIPTGTTLMCLGNFDRTHPLSLGMIGMHGEREANLAVHNSDLLISIGARFSDRVTGDTTRFARDAKILHIDIDGSEIGKNIGSDKCVIGDLKEILCRVLPYIEKNDRAEWVKQVQSYQREIPTTDYLDPTKAILAVNKVFTSDAIVATDVGQHQMWTAQKWPFTKPRHLITSGGMGTMGFGMGAAIGSKIANPDSEVVLFTGDGSFRMNLNELITASAEGVKVTVIILRNHTLGMVRQWQKLFFTKRYSATDLKDVINYEGLAESFGLKGFLVNSLEELDVALNHAKQSDTTTIIACDIYTDENVWPIVPPGDAINNQVVSE